MTLSVYVITSKSVFDQKGCRALTFAPEGWIALLLDILVYWRTIIIVIIIFYTLGSKDPEG